MLMKRCPSCGTAFIHGGEFCSMDGDRLVAVAVPPLAGVEAPEPEPEEGSHETLLAGSMSSDEPRPTGRVGTTTGPIGGGAITLALSMGDTGLIGAVFAERYMLEAVIGRGGMGVVYRARHLMLERPVALKLLRPQFLQDDRAVKRFMREAQAMARVDHPNAVAIHDFGTLPDGGAYLVMEHVEGETLRAVLGRVGSLPVADAVAVAVQVCGAVEAAHRQGVVHRDLKPENIMFKRAEEGAIVKVLDFGLAKVVDPTAASGAALTSAGDLFGTPAYMAPEFFEGDEVGPTADVYSIGLIVYEMLSGNAPFQGTVQAIMSGHLFKEPPPLDGVPPDVNRAVRRALAKAPVDRYATAAEFAACLAGALAGEAVEEPRATSGPLALEALAVELPEPSGESSVETETVGGPRLVTTADLVPPQATQPTGSGFAPPETASVRLPASLGVRRRVAAPVVAAAMAGVLLGGVAYVASSSEPPPPEPVAPQPAAAPAVAQPSEPGPAAAPPASVPDTTPAPPPRRVEESRAKVAPREAKSEPPAPRAEPRKEAKAQQADAKNTNTKKKKKWYNPKSWF